MNTPKLELYKFDSCPFCLRVMSLIESLNLKVEMRDIMHNREDLQKLVSDTGKRTVPCLYIDGAPMFESSDIMAWLQENSDNLLKNS